MGELVEGKWYPGGLTSAKHGGRFIRPDAAFRNWVTADGAAGPGGGEGFKAEPGRYHLYVSLACPWAHRTLILRKLKGLEEAIGLSVVHHRLGEQGWTFEAGDGVIPDTVNGARYLHEIYVKARPDYTGKVTVPVLWDRQRRTIVSNESSEIIRMFNSAFDRWGNDRLDFCPADLRDEIDAVNADVYPNLNNGVYRCGFATAQAAYDEAFDQLFACLDRLEERLSRQRYLAGERLTEADWRLFTTLLRFDAVYHGHFKCNLRRIADYPNLDNYLRELYQVPGVAETVNMEHIKRHYYGSHDTVNPSRIVPKGPALDFTAPHDRNRLPGEPLPLATA